MAERIGLSILKDDKLVLTNDEGVETAYIIYRIEGDMSQAQIYLKNANGVPGDVKIITYERVN